MSTPYLSIVIPIYNESDNITPLYQRLHDVLSATGKSYEIIFTNDGSRDNSFTLLQELHNNDPEHVKVIDFNGNFGQHMAVMAGFELSSGDIVITLDADLQNPPEEIPNLVTKMEQGHDLVSGIRRQRKDNWFRTYVSKAVNFVRDKITHIRMTDHGSMLRAHSRNVVDLMVASKETCLYIPGLAYTFANNPTEIDVEHDERGAGESKYSLYKLIRLNFDMVTGFSLVPLQLFTIFGMATSGASFLFVLYMFARRIFIGPEAEGVFTLFAIMFLLVGVLIMGLGLVGEYVGRIYLEVRNRPRWVIREVLARPNSSC